MSFWLADNGVHVDLGNNSGSGQGEVSIFGVERLSGSRFDDHLQGSQRDESLWGTEGGGELVGGPGNDYLDGGEGVDNCWEGESVYGCEFEDGFPDPVMRGGLRSRPKAVGFLRSSRIFVRKV